MSEDHNRESGEREEARRVETAARQSEGEEGLYMPDVAPKASSSLLAHPDMGGRGNQPVKTAVMQRLQQGYGNHAVQRFLQCERAGSTQTVTVQRDPDSTTLPPVPDVNLTPPSMLQPPDPASRYRLGSNYQLHLDPQLQASALQTVQQQLDPGNIRGILAGVRLGQLPPTPPTTSSTTATAGVSTSPSAPAAPLVPQGAGPGTPHAGSASDIMDAVLAVPVVDHALTTLQTRATEQLTLDWHRLQTGEKVVAVSAVATIGLAALGGVMSNPQTRQMALSQLNGRVLPVPGVDWLHLEVNTGGNNLMLGMHVDVGALLPASLGFGPSSPTALGGPPTPEPFVPGQRTVQRSANGEIASEESQR